MIGAHHTIASRKTEWQRELSTFEVELYCDGKLVQRGALARSYSIVRSRRCAIWSNCWQMIHTTPHYARARLFRLLPRHLRCRSSQANAGPRQLWALLSNKPLFDLTNRARRSIALARPTGSDQAPVQALIEAEAGARSSASLWRRPRTIPVAMMPSPASNNRPPV